MESPLKGLKVLDFTHLLPGQISAALLSDLGTDIVHIDAPNKASLSHKLPPIVEGESLYFWVLHKRKSSLTINLKEPKGKEVVERLIKGADILLENFRPGVMERLGLDYEKAKELNDRLIYCSISGYGQESEDRHRAAHDLNLIAESGILNLSRRNGERPILPPIPISDYMSGMLAVISILSAIYQRDRTGSGQYLDIAMLDSALSSLNVLSAMALYTEKEPEEGGFAYPRELHNYNVYRTSDDRFLAVASLEPAFHKEFLTVICRLDLLDSDLSDEELTEELTAEIAKKSLAQWGELFADSNCCVSPVNTITEALEKFPLDARDMLHTLEHPFLGTIPQVTFPISKALRDSSRDRFCVENSDQSYSRLLESGYSKKDIQELKEAGIISLYISN